MKMASPLTSVNELLKRLGLSQVAHFRAISLSLSVSTTIQLLTVLTGILLARELGPTDRGELAAATLWPLLIATIGLFGVNDAASVWAAQTNTNQKKLAGTALAIGVLQSLMLMFLGSLLIPLVLHRHGPWVIHQSLIYLTIIPLSILTAHSTAILNGSRRFASFHLLRLGLTVAIVSGLGVLAATNRLSVRHAVAVYLVSNLAVTLVSVFKLLAHTHFSLGFDSQLAGELIRFGLKSHVGNLTGYMNERLDQLVMAAFLSARQLGLYVVAVTMTSGVVLIGSSVALVVVPAVAHLKERPAQRSEIARFLQITFFGSALTIVPLMVLTPSLIRLLFGLQYMDSTTVCRLLLLAALALSTNRVLSTSMTAIHQPIQSGIAESIAAVFTVVGLLLLIPLTGVVGAGLTSLVAYAVSSSYMLFRLGKLFETPPFRLVIPQFRLSNAFAGMRARASVEEAK